MNANFHLRKSATTDSLADKSGGLAGLGFEGFRGTMYPKPYNLNLSLGPGKGASWAKSNWRPSIGASLMWHFELEYPGV